MRDAKRLVDAGTQVLAIAQLGSQLCLLARLDGCTNFAWELSEHMRILRQVEKSTAQRRGRCISASQSEKSRLRKDVAPIAECRTIRVGINHSEQEVEHILVRPIWISSVR